MVKIHNLYNLRSISIISIILLSTILIWFLIFYSYGYMLIPYKVISTDIQNKDFSFDISITKIDQQIFIINNRDKQYPKNGQFTTMHFTISNKSKNDIVLSTDLPLIDSNKTYFPLSKENLIIPAGTSRSDIIIFDNSSNTANLMLQIIYKKQTNFLFNTKYYLQI